MEEIAIITRDVNGNCTTHYMLWDRVCSYISDEEAIRDEEILLVIFEGTCIYSALGSGHQLTWDEITGFFG